jgi:hypothetical protein
MIEFEPSAVPVTGSAETDGMLASLGELGSVPVSEHVAQFEAVHQALRVALNHPAE